MQTIERHLQQNLNKIEHWATNNGLNFPSQKHSVYSFVSCENNMMILFLHYMDHLFLLVLGLIFGKKLSFIPHIKYLKARCLKSLNILKVLSHTTWGADQTTLLQLYRSLIRSKLDYRSIVYGQENPI